MRPAWGCGGSAAGRGVGRPAAPRAGCVLPRASRSARLAAAGSTLLRQDPLARTPTIRTAGHTLSGETRPASRPAPPPLPAIEATTCRGWGSQRPPLGAGSCSGERGAGGSLGQGRTRSLHLPPPLLFPTTCPPAAMWLRRGRESYVDAPGKEGLSPAPAPGMHPTARTSRPPGTFPQSPRPPDPQPVDTSLPSLC